MCPIHHATNPALESMDSFPMDIPESSSPVSDRRKSCESDEVCFICLGTGELSRPCACPRLVHERCMARWQLQQSGRREERFCRFCSTELPDWKTTLTPSHLKPAEPIMVVTLGSEVHRIKVKPGPEGVKEFEGKIRALFNIPQEVEFEVSFRCKAPTSAGKVPLETIQLDGMGSYDAATHCAALMAAQRIATGSGPAFVR